MAYHAGALRALVSVGGVDVAGADLIVGTSAGSVVGAYLRAGWTVEDMWGMAHGVHPTEGPIDDLEQRRKGIFTPAWGTPAELARRGVGSLFVMARSVLRFPMAPIPKALRRRFPAGFFSLVEGERRFTEDLPAEWPAEPLYICAVDITSGRRVVLGRPRSPKVPLATAVMASCAIPGIYQPVKVGRYTLVDGGVRSSTNLDLAATFGCDVIIGVAPMAYDTSAPPEAVNRLVRRIPSRSLSSEMSAAKAKGAEVLLVRPTASELRVHGLNSMRPDASEKIAAAAYESTARLLETDRFRSLLRDAVS